jgi:hypothetical protein
MHLESRDQHHQRDDGEEDKNEEGDIVLHQFVKS